MRPEPWRFMGTRAARAALKVPRRLTAITLSQSSALVFSSQLPGIDAGVLDDDVEPAVMRHRP